MCYLGNIDCGICCGLWVVGCELWVEQGSYDEALPMLKRSLEIDQKVHGDDHPNVAAGLNSLGRLLQDMVGCVGWGTRVSTTLLCLVDIVCAGMWMCWGRGLEFGVVFGVVFGGVCWGWWLWCVMIACLCDVGDSTRSTVVWYCRDVYCRVTHTLCHRTNKCIICGIFCALWVLGCGLWVVNCGC